MGRLIAWLRQRRRDRQIRNQARRLAQLMPDPGSSAADAEAQAYTKDGTGLL